MPISFDKTTAQILLIDDDEIVRIFYQSLLQQAGYGVTVASSGEEGIGLLKKNPFDLLIVDIHLGGMDGIELLRKAKERDPDLEVIIITADATIESTLQAIEADAFDYLIKTDNRMPDAILHRVKKALHKRWLVKENKALIRNLSRREKELEKNVFRIKELLGFINSVNASRNMAELIDRLQTDLCGMLGVRLYSIFLYDREAKVLRLFSSTHAMPAVRLPDGQDRPTGENLVITPGQRKESLMDEVITRRKAVVIDDFSQSRYSRDPDNQSVERYLSPSVISIPLFSGRRLIGVLNVNGKINGVKTFTADDVQFVSILGENLAAAIHNHLLMDELKQKVVALDASLSQLKMAQDRLVQTEKLAAMSVLVAGVAHEIKNPLNAMVLTIENLDDVLKLKACPPVSVSHCGHAEEVNRVYSLCRKYGGMLRTEIGRLKKLVEDFLDFTRSPMLKSEPVNLSEAIEAALTNLEPEIIKGGVQIARKVGRRLPPVSGDRDGLHRVLVNLLLNAVQAMPYGGTLTVAAGVKSDRLFITVRDTGTGISKENLPRVFDPFFTTKAGGVGLGLSLVYKTVQAMGGEIKLDSAKGQGTEVLLTFPLKRD
ncbi:MAG: response regulator [Nitrospirae bacterium]|nr:response regulator [Nitrospirota bacterium]